jgi:hypothetical protein
VGRQAYFLDVPDTDSAATLSVVPFKATERWARALQWPGSNIASTQLKKQGVSVADIFIKIDGITGESQDAFHLNEIDVIGWRWKVSAVNHDVGFRRRRG